MYDFKKKIVYWIYITIYIIWKKKLCTFENTKKKKMSMLNILEKYMFVSHIKHTQRKINKFTSFAIDNMYHVSFKI